MPNYTAKSCNIKIAAWSGVQLVCQKTTHKVAGTMNQH